MALSVWRCRPCAAAERQRQRHGPPTIHRDNPAITAARAAPQDGGSSTTTTTTTTTSTTSTDKPAPAPPMSTEAILDRIARARRYKDASSTPAPTQQPSSGERLPNLGPAQVDWGAMVGFLEAPVATERGGGSAGDAGGGAQAPASLEDLAEREKVFMAPSESKDTVSLLSAAPRRDGGGSADRAASSLQGVLAASTDGDISPDMRMEEYSLLREAKLRALGSEIITSDASYRPVGEGLEVRVSIPGAGMMAGPEAVATAQRAAVELAAREREEEAARERAREVEEKARAAEAEAARALAAEAEAAGGSALADSDANYKPTVTTWGVFPRPNNISEAYGGGRDIKPGQELETPKQRAAREASYANALAAYRSKAGLDIDPLEEEAAMVLYQEGMVLFAEGAMRPAFDKFDAALAKAPVKTKVGGMATLQKAIILDSAGQGDEAKKLYKRVTGHAVASVSRKARQMLFGFEAMSFMKAEQFTYGPKKSDFDQYFRRIADRTKIYIATDEERATDEFNARLATAIAVAVIIMPIVAVAGLASGR